MPLPPGLKAVRYLQRSLCLTTASQPLNTSHSLHIIRRRNTYGSKGPCVIKADGLAAGKGVFVAETVDEAINAVECHNEGQAFGDAGDKVIIEQCLKGEEASFMVLIDGDTMLAALRLHRTIRGYLIMMKGLIQVGWALTVPRL